MNDLVYIPREQDKGATPLMEIIKEVASYKKQSANQSFWFHLSHSGIMGAMM